MPACWARARRFGRCAGGLTWGARMEMVYFTVIGLGLYAVSDALLDFIERKRGKRFENRQVIFFVIILLLALITFELMDVMIRPSA